MKILGIETSCDETAAAVVENGTKTLSNVVASSVKLHQKVGGIIPEVAAREQVKYIVPVINEAMKQGNNLTMKDIDTLAVTIGPGLIGSLLVGIETAKTLSFLFKKPIVPVNHLLGHIYANWLNKRKLPTFPAIALVVSGGHTELVLMKNHGKFTSLGGTRDDAAGEAFDKIARVLGLGFPGGPEIEREALKFKVQGSRLKIKLPRPMINEDNFDFSFSGLKTAVLREVKKLKSLHQFNNSAIQQLGFETQEAISDVLVKKTIKAAKKFKAKSILLSGGVAANKRLREKFKLALRNSKFLIHFHAPKPSLCIDNAAPIASYAFFNFRPILWQKIIPFSSLETQEQSL